LRGIDKTHGDGTLLALQGGYALARSRHDGLRRRMRVGRFINGVVDD